MKRAIGGPNCCRVQRSIWTAVPDWAVHQCPDCGKWWRATFQADAAPTGGGWTWRRTFGPVAKWLRRRGWRLMTFEDFR